MTASTNVRSTVTEEGVVLLDVSSGKIFHSNPIGSRVWTKLQEGSALPDIVDEITTEFKAPREQVEADILEYVQSLKSNGLIVEGFAA
jgi:Coenzyme PQQ synthesis protein D (PqqD)